MAQSTGMLEAMTLHSLLGLQGDFCSKDKQDKPLQIDFLIVDEASMVDRLIHAKTESIIKKYMEILHLNKQQLSKLNKFRKEIGLEEIKVQLLRKMSPSSDL